MSTTVRRLSAVLSFILSLTLVTTALGAAMSTATAAPAQLGQVQNLQVDAVSVAGGRYRISATWNPLARATAYVVKLAINGENISSARTPEPTWSDTVAGAAGASAKVTVTPFNGKRRGKPRSKTITLPDLTPPTGAYTVDVQDVTATVTQTALDDNLTPRDQVARFIDWGEGGDFEPYPAGAVATHDYPDRGRWVPRVKLVDLAGNEAILTLDAAVVRDSEGPSADYSLSTTSAWSRWTAVTLTETGLDDDWSPNETIVRRVDWGDGVVDAGWTPASASHVYPAAGTYEVRVTLVDESGNETVEDVSTPVVVTDDTVAPTVTWRLPMRRLSVRAWRYIRGSAVDHETDVAVVRVKMVQRRAGRWVAFRSGRWVRRATKAGALRAATARQRQVSDVDRWSVRARGLRRGLLVYRAWATDEVGNIGPKVTRQQRITKR
jgi:hypothetical protein